MERYYVEQWHNGDWWVIDRTLPDDDPKKIISAHSQKEAACSTADYQNSLNED